MNLFYCVECQCYQQVVLTKWAFVGSSEIHCRWNHWDSLLEVHPVQKLFLHMTLKYSEIEIMKILKRKALAEGWLKMYTRICQSKRWITIGSLWMLMTLDCSQAGLFPPILSFSHFLSSNSTQTHTKRNQRYNCFMVQNEIEKHPVCKVSVLAW